MSTNDYILNLLNIKILDGKQEIKKIKGNNYKIIEGYLTYIPSYCQNCGCVNETANDIIKCDFRKNCKIKIQTFLIAFQCYYCISKDFYVNIVKTHLLLKLL
ncbi:transposase [Mycoplasma sp. CAG:956]|nr:transposase [Mycoplasma sp. CAG:956]